MALKRDELKQHATDAVARASAPAPLGTTATPSAPTRSKSKGSPVVQVRWPADDLELVRRYFAERGMTLSGGIKHAVAEYMRR